MCECELCLRLKYYNEVGVPEDVIDHILNIEMDLEYLQCIMNGSWPNGKRILEKALEKYNG